MTLKPLRLPTSAPDGTPDCQAVAAQVPLFPVSLAFPALPAHHHSGTGNTPTWAAQADAGPETPDATPTAPQQARR